MSAYKHFSRHIIQFMMRWVLGHATVYAAIDTQRHSFNGMTRIVGTVIATPCSIAMTDRYQTINFSPLTLPLLSTASGRERYSQPFIIELHGCGSMDSTIDSKTWSIRFSGHTTQNINAFVLQGPSHGLGISVLDEQRKRLVPEQRYFLSNHVLRQDKSGETLFLRYFLQLELTGQPIQAGSYQGLVRFFIDYQ